MESALIDVAVATIFFFVTLSLISATITEFLSRFWELRSANFKAGLDELIGQDLANRIIAGKFAPPSSKGKVHHIEPRQFALAISEVVDLTSYTAIDNANIPDELKQTLKTFRRAAGKQLADIRKEIEEWFDSAMTEVGVWYRNNAQVITRFVAAILVLALNADTITLVDRAWQDRALRESLVSAAAAAAVEKPDPAGNSEKKSLSVLKEEIESQLAPFPIGWRNLGEFTDDWRGCLNREFPHWTDYLKKALGLFITYIALTLGAPFWFDVLKRVMKLRSQLRHVQQKKE
jgi:hypothetical protein